METNNKPDFEMPDPKGVLYEATKQNGKPGHCYQAQIFKDGKAFIAIEPTEDPWDATKTAFFITKALYHFDALQSENQALKSELDKAKQEIQELERRIDNLKYNLPQDCVEGYDEVKFCNNRQSGNERCRWCG